MILEQKLPPPIPFEFLKGLTKKREPNKHRVVNLSFSLMILVLENHEDSGGIPDLILKRKIKGADAQ